MTEAVAAELATLWGRRIRRTRRASELTATEVAKRAGISRTYLHDIEAGRYRPSDALRVRIARVLGVEPSDLFTYDTREAS
jgi:transcriptional regulator with XRE-family HTH domain